MLPVPVIPALNVAGPRMVIPSCCVPWPKAITAAVRHISAAKAKNRFMVAPTCSASISNADESHYVRASSVDCYAAAAVLNHLRGRYCGVVICYTGVTRGVGECRRAGECHRDGSSRKGCRVLYNVGSSYLFRASSAVNESCTNGYSSAVVVVHIPAVGAGIHHKKSFDPEPL